MPATLTEITDGRPIVSDDLTNERTAKCPRREQTYRLGYSDNEWQSGKGLVHRLYGVKPLPVPLGYRDAQK
jgi:hypothetical protein